MNKYTDKNSIFISDKGSDKTGNGTYKKPYKTWHKWTHLKKNIVFLEINNNKEGT